MFLFIPPGGDEKYDNDEIFPHLCHNCMKWICKNILEKMGKKNLIIHSTVILLYQLMKKEELRQNILPKIFFAPVINIITSKTLRMIYQLFSHMFLGLPCYSYVPQFTLKMIRSILSWLRIITADSTTQNRNSSAITNVRI